MLPYKFNHRAVPEVAAQKTRALGRGDDFDRLCFARSLITSSSWTLDLETLTTNVFI